MGSAIRPEYYQTPEEYLAGERVSQEKHEYLAGVIYAMAGTSIGHDRIAGNIYRHLGNQLSGKPCEAFSSDVKVRIRKDAADFFYYPDVTIDCSGAGNAALFADEPRVSVEVLSPDTERIDRGEKLRNYQALPSLEVYALVDQFHIAVTLYRRTAQGWEMEFLTEVTDVISLASIDCALPLSTIYERTYLLRDVPG
jgi:Uma2 family endonuclease